MREAYPARATIESPLGGARRVVSVLVALILALGVAFGATADPAAAASGTIKGHVTDNAGGNVDSLCVNAHSLDGSHTSGVQTDANGNYTIEGLSTASYKVEFAGWCGPNGPSHNLATQWYNDKPKFSSANPVSVIDGQSTSGINAQMHPGGQIKGHVADNNGGNLADICVRVEPAFSSSEPGFSGGFTRTDANGNYTVKSLSTDSFKVQFYGCPTYPVGHVGNWATQWYNGKLGFYTADAVPVTAGQDTTINVQMQPGGQIKGHVADNSGGNLANICVAVQGPSEVWGDSQGYVESDALTDASGNYTVQALRTGTYKVEFAPPYSCSSQGGSWVSRFYNNKPDWGSANTVSVTAGQTTTGINAQLQPGNNAPTCQDQGVAVVHDTGALITLACSDADPGDTITYSILDQPTHGWVSLPNASGQATYTPTSGYSGPDAFTFKATDNHSAGSATATVALNVAGAAGGGNTIGNTSGTTSPTTNGPTTASPVPGPAPPAYAAIANAMTMTSTAFAAENSGPSATAAKRKGTTVSFKLNRASAVVFTIQRPTEGRKTKHGKTTTCDQTTHGNRKKKCARYATLKGSFRRGGATGTNKFHFTGRLNGKKLSPGKYRLVATPRTGLKTGIATTTAFRIVR